MGLFQQIKGMFGGRSPQSTGGWVSVMTGRRKGFGDKTPDELLQSYRGIVYSCVSSISDLVSTMRVELYRIKKNGDREKVQIHPLLDLFGRVNNFMTFQNLIEITQMHLDLTGEAFWYLARNGRKEIQEIWTLSPDRVKVIPDPVDFIKGYVYSPDGSQKIPMEKEEVVHFKYYDPYNLYRGISPLRAAMRDYVLYESGQEMNLNFFENASVPSGFVSTDEPINKEDFERLQAQYRAKYEGKDNAFRVVFLSHGMKPYPTQVNPKDLLLIDQMKMTAEDIRMAFKVPKIALLSYDDIKYDNAEAGHKTYMMYTILPKMRRLVATLNEFLVPQFGTDLLLDLDNPMPIDPKYQAELDKSYVDTVKTRNEIREDLNLEPLEGGDVLYMPLGMVPLGTDTVTQIDQVKRQNELLTRQVEILSHEKNKVDYERRIMAETRQKS